MFKILYKIVLFFLFTAFSFLVFAQSNTDECLSCHQELDDELLLPAKNYVNDIHFINNITCAACHGGDATADDDEIAMSEENGFIGVPDRSERYKACISCHSDEQKMKGFGSDLRVDQYKKLETSIHFQSTNNDEGPIADCVTCHSVHDIKSIDDPQSKVYPTNVPKLCGSCHSNANLMKNYNPSLPVDQVIKYRTSKHGLLNAKGDPNVAQCASCHGYHDIGSVNDSRSYVYATNIPEVCASCHSNSKLMSKYGLPTDQYESYVKSVHGMTLLEKEDISAPSCNDCHGNHGAVPPGIESISKVCGSCHVLNMELFEKSPHQKAFDENDFPECETCHGNHEIRYVTDDMVGTEESAVCMDCHSNEKEDKGYLVAGEMKLLIDSLKFEDKETKEILSEATQKGMDVSDAEYSLKDVRQVLIQTRTSIHTFNLDKFKESIKPGFETISKVKQEGIAAVDDYYFRRLGLGISTIIVTMLVIGLYFKIRKMENKT